MLTIGEFSKVCFVTRKTLRYYDEIGLLKPSYTAENGYRYYTGDQLKTMRLITRLRGYGCSLPEIAAVLAREEDTGFLMETLERQHTRLRAELAGQEQCIAALERDMEKLKRSDDMMKTNVQVKLTDRQPVYLFSHRKMMGIEEFDQGYAELFECTQKTGIPVVGPPYAVYHDTEFNRRCSDIELGVQVAGPGENVRELGGGLHAYATHVGPFNAEFSSIYAQVVEWIEESGYAMAGPPFDEYVKSMVNGAASPEDYITNVCFPVREK